jgi:MFS family permease
MHLEPAAIAYPPARRAPLLALLSASAISLAGSTLTWIALPWFVLQTTGSAALTGLAGFFVALPGFVAGVFGGTLVDRLGYKRMSVAADLVSGVAIALAPLLYATVGLPYWQLLALIFVGELLTIPGLTARRSMLPELAAQAAVRLERVNASFESLQHLAVLLGPPLAGVLIVALGAGNVLWLDAASFAASALIVALAIPPQASGVRPAAGRYRDQLVAGLRFLRGDRLLLALAISLGITNFFSNTLLAVILPVYVKTTLGSPTALGLLAAAFGAGALAGAAVYGAVGHRLPRRAIWLAGFLASPVIFWALAMQAPLPLLMAAAALEGLLGGPINPMLVTLRHERIPAEMRGRVFSTFSAISQVASPLGIVLAGLSIEAVGVRSTALTIAAGAQLVTVAMLFIPVFHAMNVGIAPGGGAQPRQ